jgi:hypothetical protein
MYNDNTKQENSMSEQPSSPSYEEIWNTLVQVDVSKHVEKKNGLSYLSWAWAWGVLMEYYPQAQYGFLDEKTYSDGTVAISCKVTIGDCWRVMWLPVMDYKNNAIRNPDARKISDTRMRCLVKCLAMFGLGHAIYAGEDVAAVTTPDGEAEAPLIDETPVKQKPKKTVLTKQGFTDIPDEAGAAEVVQKLLEFANKFCSDTNSLRKFWGENKQVIDILDSHYKAQFEVLKTGFTELKTKLEGASTNG